MKKPKPKLPKYVMSWTFVYANQFGMNSNLDKREILLTRNMMKAAFLIWIIAAWTIERFTTQSCCSSASLLLHQLYNNGFNSLSGLKAHYFHSKYTNLEHIMAMIYIFFCF